MSLVKVYGKLRDSEPLQGRNLNSKLEDWKCLTAVFIRAVEIWSAQKSRQIAKFSQSSQSCCLWLKLRLALRPCNERISSSMGISFVYPKIGKDFWQTPWVWLLSVGKGPLEEGLLPLSPLWLHWEIFTSHTSSLWNSEIQRQGFHSANSLCPVLHPPGWLGVICHDSRNTQAP